MKLFYIFLIPLFFSCNAKNKDIDNTVQNIDINKDLNLEDLGEYSSADIPLLFVLGEYNLKNYSDLDTISAKDYNLDKVVYDNPTIGIQYSFDYKPESNSFTDRSFELKADNGKNFTIRELLFKINQKTFDAFSKDDHYILEGLLHTDTVKNNIEYYELMLGS